MSTPVISGPEFMMNMAPNAGAQLEPTIAALGGGRFAAIWVESPAAPPDNSGTRLHGQILNAAGQPLTTEFLVNNAFEGDQRYQGIAALTDGRFVVTWTTTVAASGDGNGGAVKARVFSAAGVPEAPEFVVNTYTLSDQVFSAITALADGGYIITWQSPTFAQVGFDIRAQIYNANGSPRSGEFFVSFGLTQDEHRQNDVTQLANGKIAVVWEQFAPLDVNAHDRTGSGVVMRLFDASGGALTGIIPVNTATADDQLDPTAAGLTGGNVVVTWADDSRTGGDAAGFSIKAQIFNDAGVKVGGEFLVNTTTESNQITPAIKGLSDGRFIIAWVSGANTVQDIHAQLFEANGTKSGSEFIVNVSRASNQINPTITELTDGRIMIGWRDGAGSAAGDILGQAYDPREAAVNFTGTGAADIAFGTRFGETLLGLAGADNLYGGAGDDVVLGGADNDTLRGEAGADYLAGEAGDDQLNMGGAAAGYDIAFGGEGADVIANAAAGLLYAVGGDGADVISTGDASDLNQFVYVFGDDLSGGAGADTITKTGTGRSYQSGGAGNDTLTGGNQILPAGEVADYLFGDGGADSLVGNGGFDVLVGSNYATTTSDPSGDPIDTLNGGAGADYVLQGLWGRGLLDGGDGDDTIVGAGGADTLIGGAGDDLLFGAGGVDVLRAGVGNDFLYGGGGGDRFEYALADMAAGSVDQIVDFYEAGSQLIIAGATRLQTTFFEFQNVVGGTSYTFSMAIVALSGGGSQQIVAGYTTAAQLEAATSFV